MADRPIMNAEKLLEHVAREICDPPPLSYDMRSYPLKREKTDADRKALADAAERRRRRNAKRVSLSKGRAVR